ncbi:MAG: hypothetical protein ACE3L7_25020 [Candidatus Pristimantibacillus sp.]
MVKMSRKWNVPAIIIFSLMGIGLVYMLISNPGGFLLPIIILGGIFLLYKFPPSTWSTKSQSNQQPYVKQNRTKPQQRPKSRRTPFRVINGGKDDNDDDDLPKYH